MGGSDTGHAVQTLRMNAIITDLLELSRLESTDGEAPRDLVDVPKMLERLHRDALAAGDRPRHISLDLESEDGLYGSPRKSSPPSPTSW